MTDVAPGPGRLAGRDRELAALREALAQALAGHGRLVVLTGPPGIGKTRLAEELANGARRSGQRVLWGRAVDERGAPPLWPWRRILRAVGGAGDDTALTGGVAGGSARSDGLAAARFRAAAAAADALVSAAHEADLLVVLEDLQWADHASLFLLRELAAELPGSRLLVLATCRDAAGDRWHAALGDLARLPGLQVLRLAPLDEPAVAEILHAAGLTADAARARAVHARSEGNALYVTTLARVLAAQPGPGPGADAVARAAGGSAEVSYLVSALLRDVDDNARAVLAAASVFGTDFDTGLVAAVCETGRDVTGALLAAEAAGLVRRQPNRVGSWCFGHALIRDGIYARLGEDELVALHRRAAAALVPAASQAPERGGEVAAHLLRSAPDRSALRQAAGWATEAATAATSALAFEDATGYLTTALDAAQAAGAGDAERSELLIELATAEYRAGQLATSLRHAAAAADAAERDGRLDLVADAALVVRGIGDHSVAETLLRLCDRALADRDCPPARRARLLAQRASALVELGDTDAAAAEAMAATAAAAAASDPTAELDAIRAQVAALPVGYTPAGRLRLGSRAIELAAVTGQPLAGVLGRVWRIDAAYQLLNLAAVDAEISQLARLAEATRLPLVRWHLLRQQASRAVLAGQLTVARDLNWDAFRLGTRIQDFSGAGMSYAFAVWLAAVRGDAADIPADFFAFADAAPRIPIVRVSVARALLIQGRSDEAHAEYGAIREVAISPVRNLRTFGTVTQLVDLMVAFGDQEAAQAAYDVFRPLPDTSGATGTGVVFLSGSLHWQLGRLAAVLGRTGQAVDHFATAVTVNARIAARPFVVLSRLDCAGALRQQGGRDACAQAGKLARQAAMEARRLDMPGPAGRAERLVQDIEQAMDAADPLTRREREIAELISAGLTNRAIADRLVLSERTIEGHVRSALGKLQLTNRTELAAWALRDARRE